MRQQVQARKNAEVTAAQTHAQEKDQRLTAEAQKQADNQRAAEQKRAVDQAADLQRKADRDQAAEIKRQQALTAEQQRASDTAAREQAAKAKPDADVRSMGGRDAEAKVPIADTTQEQARKDAAGRQGTGQTRCRCEGARRRGRKGRRKAGSRRSETRAASAATRDSGLGSQRSEEEKEGRGGQQSERRRRPGRLSSDFIGIVKTEIKEGLACQSLFYFIQRNAITELFTW